LPERAAFHGERVAADAGWIEVALESPGVHDLAAFCFIGSTQLNFLPALNLVPLQILAARRGEWSFGCSNLPLGIVHAQHLSFPKRPPKTTTAGTLPRDARFDGSAGLRGSTM